MIRRVRQEASFWWAQRSPSTRSLPLFIGRALQNYVRTGTGSRQAAALSYFSIFSIFPLTLLLAVGIGGVLGPAVAQEQIIQGLSLFLPDATVNDIQTTVTNALQQGSSFGLVATIALFWAATGLFSNITLSLDSIFDVPASRSVWRQRALALVMGVTLVVLVVASFVTSGVLRLISAFTPGIPNIWITISIFFLPLGLDVVIFALLFRYVPSREVHWDAVWPAAIFGAIGWELAKRGFEWYLANLANYPTIYGGIATGIILLFWAWLIASIFLFSAQLCARLNEWMEAEEQRITALQEQNRLVSVYFHAQRLPPPPVAPILDKPVQVQEDEIQITG